MAQGLIWLTCIASPSEIRQSSLISVAPLLSEWNKLFEVRRIEGFDKNFGNPDLCSQLVESSNYLKGKFQLAETAPL
ncbi:hypothetical protein QLG07_05235 [Erwinia sp. V90_4]|uniref:hypothetical protein n=1 Tax=Erwinia sp. V90_4 TaxID=3044239 RepID=UPI00249E1C70|nr:hypothetical protein [Erwinia sp. V90_4]MDI3438848.1 hypothetical protein [Erwinia sp. V90_4]